MIPAAIFYGLIGGLIPRYRWWSVPLIGVIWSITLSIAGDPHMSFVAIWFGGFTLGALNGAVGVAFTAAISKIVHLLFQLARNQRVAE